MPDTFTPVNDVTDIMEAVSISFAPFGLTEEEMVQAVDHAEHLTAGINTQLLEWCKKTRNDALDMPGMAACYIAVHMLYHYYNRWFHAELAELNKQNIPQEASEVLSRSETRESGVCV